MKFTPSLLSTLAVSLLALVTPLQAATLGMLVPDLEDCAVTADPVRDRAGLAVSTGDDLPPVEVLYPEYALRQATSTRLTDLLGDLSPVNRLISGPDPVTTTLLPSMSSKMQILMRAAQQSPVRVIPLHIYYVYDPAAMSTDRAETIGRAMANVAAASIGDHFRPIGLHFELKTSQIIGSAEFYPLTKLTPQEMALKRSSRKGGMSHLNVWITEGHTSPRTWGSWGTFPWNGEPLRDGIVYTERAALLGAHSTTLTHEIGHWLGLLHTFQGGCSGTDYVDDTPQVERMGRMMDCPLDYSSCDNGETDMVHNFMDYTPNECRTLFTNGQYERMLYHYLKYRKE